MMNKRKVGSEWEDRAVKYLSANGLIIRERNFSCRFGEIDIIASDNGIFVFVEVKYRKNASAGHPEEAVNSQKVRKISKVADYYRVYRKIPADARMRFDVVAIEGESIRWYKDAFSYMH